MWQLLALPLNQSTEITKVAKSLNFVPVNKCDTYLLVPTPPPPG